MPTPPCPLCAKTGDHYCADRADRAVDVCEKILVHTKGRWARTPFKLAGWQRDGIVRPLFGEVVYDAHLTRYVRRYRIAWIELPRKNGKSELLAAIALILLLADGEESAEVYGAAADKDQARKVWDVAERMVKLSPVLAKRHGLRVYANPRRIVDERTGSFYEIVASDWGGNLGHNPHGIIFDELLTQKSSDLWDALRTGMGAREQPLMVAATTAGHDQGSFAYRQHLEMLRIAEDPDRARHIFTFIRAADPEDDAWDEATWAKANPALGNFLNVRDLRDEAREARNDPARENVFRMLRLNQWVQAVTRYIRLDDWDRCVGPTVAPSPDWLASLLEGKRAFGGLDLSSTTDLTAWALLFPDADFAVWLRAWVPEARIQQLDQHLGGQASVWVRQGWLTATEGDVVDYDLVLRQIREDMGRFKVADVSHDRWLAEPIRQQLDTRRLPLHPVPQTYQGLSLPTKELHRRITAAEIAHAGNPVLRWAAESLEVRTDDAENVKPVKPDRDATGARIDPMVAVILALDGWLRRGQQKQRRSLAAGF